MKKQFTTLLLVLCSITLVPCSMAADRYTDNIQAEGQTRKLAGKVTDDNGEPVIGATVVIKGLNQGTTTNQQGSFIIDIPVQDKVFMVFSNMGKVTKEIEVTNQSFLNVEMATDMKKIDEVVIVGAYGSIQKKADMVGSAFQINAKQIETLPTTRVDAMLEGLIPGLRIEPNSDSPSESTRYRIRVRGGASLNAGQEPLWVIDGAVMYTGDKTNMISGMSYSVNPLSFLDPNDIESITLLKDAVETSIYGANGSNGIIMVTTKKGKKGDPTVRTSFKYGIGTTDKSTKLKVLNGKQYLGLAKQAWVNHGLDIKGFPYQDSDINDYSSTDTDWYDQFYGIGRTMDLGLSISGGTDKMNNYFSMGYMKDNPITQGASQERISARLNVDYKLGDKLSMKFKIGTSYNINNLFSPGHDFYDQLPIMSPYYSNGDRRQLSKEWEQVYLRYYPSNPLQSDIDPWTGERVTENKTVFFPYEKKYFNAVAYREENENKQRILHTDLNAGLDYKVIEGLTLSANFGADFSGYHEQMYQARTNFSGMEGKRPTADIDPQRRLILTPKGKSTRSQANHLVWSNVEKATYGKRIGKHNINGMAGFEITNSERQNLQATGNGFPNDMIQEVAYVIDSLRRGSSGSDITRSMSYFGQVRYAFDDRYYLTVNYRADGNSDFGEYVRWSSFASAGVSWNIHNERFFDVSFIDLFKVKASFGSQGNSKVSGSLSNGVYTYSETYLYNGALGATMTTIPTPGLSWETTYKTNVGLSLRLFNRVDIDVEYYYNLTDNLLSELPVSNTIGDRKIYRNAGKLRNRGIEAFFTVKNIDFPGFKWTTDFNISHNSNKILELYQDGVVSFGNKTWMTGQDKDVWTLIRWAGVDPRDGNPLWYDKDGNITRIYNYNNRVPYKTSSPTVYGGLTNSFRWKSLELRVFLNYSIGGWQQSTLMINAMNDGREITSNHAVDALDYWKRPGELSPNPRLEYSHIMKSRSFNTRDLYNSTFFQLKNASLSYDIPKPACKKLGLASLRVTFVCDNVGLWTQRDYANRNSLKTFMYGSPLQRTFSLSADLSF